jgi:hypothetical protein
MVGCQAILKGFGIVALLAACVSLEVIPIAPVYLYPTSLPMSAPRRTQWLPLWSIFILLLVISAVFTLGVWNRYTLPLGSVLRLLVMLTGAVTIASIICSGFHVLLGTPRPDSSAQCSTSNVTFAHCSQVLSRADAVRQFQSFPASEAALFVLTGVMLSVVVGVFVPHSNVILRYLPIEAAVLASAYLIVDGAYIVMDVVAGAAIGFLCAHLAAEAIGFADKNTPLSAARQADVRVIYKSIIEAKR